MEEAKEVHSSLKLSAGIFQCAREQQAQLPAQIEKATDLDVRVIESYLIQCQVCCIASVLCVCWYDVMIIRQRHRR